MPAALAGLLEFLRHLNLKESIAVLGMAGSLAVGAAVASPSSEDSTAAHKEASAYELMYGRDAPEDAELESAISAAQSLPDGDEAEIASDKAPRDLSKNRPNPNEKSPDHSSSIHRREEFGESKHGRDHPSSATGEKSQSDDEQDNEADAREGHKDKDKD